MDKPPFAHEPSAIAARRVIGVGTILAVVVIVIVITIRFVLAHWIVPQHAQVVARPAAIPPAPRLQPHPGTDLAALRTQKQALLSNWSWTDPTHQFARIPIDRAMTLYAQQHAKVQDSNATASPADPVP